MNSRKAKLYIDDTGAVGDGTYAALDATISSDATSRWQTVEEKCRGDEEKSYSPEFREYEIPATIKFKKGDALIERLHAAHGAGTMVGVICSTGDTTANSDNAGNLGVELNALVETFSVTKQSGSMIEVSVTFKPHADNTNNTVPRMFVVASA